MLPSCDLMLPRQQLCVARLGLCSGLCYLSAALQLQLLLALLHQALADLYGDRRARMLYCHEVEVHAHALADCPERLRGRQVRQTRLRESGRGCAILAGWPAWAAPYSQGGQHGHMAVRAWWLPTFVLKGYNCSTGQSAPSPRARIAAMSCTRTTLPYLSALRKLTLAMSDFSAFRFPCARGVEVGLGVGRSEERRVGKECRL